MSTVRVALGERSYDVTIEADALSHLAAHPPGEEIAILSNETVAPLYAAKLAQAWRERGLKVLWCLAPDGESAKNLDWTARAYDLLAQGGLTRRGTIVAVGGGVVGDWAGFVAATWMRGVDFVQVPTTLLAMVDSSVGGKTGVNHPRAKNLIGAFHQPKQVWIDTDCLCTLPARELRAGLSEVVKYGVIADAEFFGWLEANAEKALQLEAKSLKNIIARCVQIKAEVVGDDERESDASGRRATLNYGHTVGHAIEATTQYGTYLHGEAISIGMTVAALLALATGIISRDEGEELLRRQTALFARLSLPTRVPAECTFERLWAAMALDKKSRGAQINFLLPSRLGRVEWARGVSENLVREAIEASR